MNIEDIKNLAKAIYGYAEEHYDEGWDSIVECYDLADIEEDIIEFKIKSIKAYYVKLVKPYNEHKADIAASAF